MKAVILYRPNTESETGILEYIRNFEQQTSKQLELVDVDTPSGIELAGLYDIVRFPTIIAINDDGQFIQAWPERDEWPTVSELSFYN